MCQHYTFYSWWKVFKGNFLKEQALFNGPKLLALFICGCRMWMLEIPRSEECPRSHSRKAVHSLHDSDSIALKKSWFMSFLVSMIFYFQEGIFILSTPHRKSTHMDSRHLVLKAITIFIFQIDTSILKMFAKGAGMTFYIQNCGSNLHCQTHTESLLPFHECSQVPKSNSPRVLMSPTLRRDTTAYWRRPRTCDCPAESPFTKLWDGVCCPALVFNSASLGSPMLHSGIRQVMECMIFNANRVALIDND